MSIMDKSSEHRYWHGRRVFLADKANNFRCGGCYLTRMNPVLIINADDPFIQIHKIVEAVQASILIDITDNPRGLKVGGIGHSATKMENTGKKLFITVDKNGGMAIKSAETPEEIAECEKQIKKTGIIVPTEYKVANPLDTVGRIQGGDAALVLHNLEEKISNANLKVFGETPTIKPGPHKVN